MFIVFKLIKKMQKKMYCIINMNYLLIASVLVLISLLILGITFYFGNPKDNVDNVENVENVDNVDIVDIDIDPLGDIEADENPEPVKNNIAVSGEPDINMEPEVISVPVNPPNKPEENVTSSPTPTTTPAKPLVPVIKKSAVTPPSASSTTTDEDVPVQPTPTTTPAKPLVPVIKNRMLTAQELKVIYDRVFREVRESEERRRPPANARQDREINCFANAIAEVGITEISNFKFSEDKIKNLNEGGHINDNINDYQEQRLMQILPGEAFERLRQRCQTLSLSNVNGVTHGDAKPLVPVIKKRMLTAQELHAFYDIVFREVRWEEERRHPSANARQDRENNCYAKSIVELVITEISNFKFSEDKIKNLIETGDMRENMDEYQEQRLKQILPRDAFDRIRQQCGLAAQIVPRDVPHNAAAPPQSPYSESSMIIGKRGKFQSEGGADVNNKTDILSFPPARSADLHIEHVDVHRGDPQNKNAYIIFKYKNESHKFTFVGNGGLRFKKKDGTFGPNLGVGDASSVVLRDLGLPIDSYKIECLTTTGRNTWHFKPLDLSKELIGVQMTDNADWGGLRGVYFKAVS